MAADSTSRAALLPPPRLETGVVGWMRINLFSAWHNSALTVMAIAALALALWYGLGWIVLDADWRVVPTLGGRLIIGQYNIEVACPGQNCFWRPQAALLLITVLLGMAWYVAGGGLTKRIAMLVGGVAAAFAFLPLGLDQMGLDVRLLLLANVPAVAVGWAAARYTRLGSASGIAILSVMAFVLTLVLLRGVPGVPFLHPVSVIYWGGLMLNLLLAIAGIALSLPIGIALALGRRSRLQVVKFLCIAFIETFRGVPLITLLFMSQVLVPLAFPDNFPQNSLFRAAIVITLFSSAYMAENIRGGLQSLNPGQAEAARALGLPGWQTTLFISLPQAVRNVIPPIVGQFISLFKDTSLVYIIGMLDVVEISRAFIQGNPEYLSSAKEVFIFLALVFWVFTYGMSYVSRRVEQHLGVGER
ncbi:MAG: amino acid ABC transporter permease [Planctomyces sp.]|nr:amino acid ABC transporter permease [Planctomyces sp.]